MPRLGGTAADGRETQGAVCSFSSSFLSVILLTASGISYFPLCQSSLWAFPWLWEVSWTRIAQAGSGTQLVKITKHSSLYHISASLSLGLCKSQCLGECKGCLDTQQLQAAVCCGCFGIGRTDVMNFQSHSRVLSKLAWLCLISIPHFLFLKK